MSKIKFVLIVSLFVLISTLAGVSGFYVKENSSAVVGWLNNQYVVTNEDYKDYVDKTQKSAAELKSEINRLTNENNQLNFELENVTNKKLEAELDSANKQELIDSYILEIENLNTEIAENNEMIDYLRSYLSDIYGTMLKNIVSLPSELESGTLDFFPVLGSNDFYVYKYYESPLYYFNYDSGYLVKVTDSSVGTNNYFSVRRVRNLDFFYLSNTGLCAYDFNAGNLTKLVSGYTFAYFNVLEFKDLVYILSPNVAGYYDFTNNEFVVCGEFSNSLSNYFNIWDYEQDAVYMSCNGLFYLDKINKTVTKLGSVYYQNYTPDVFKYRGNYYYVGYDYVSSVKTWGLYKLDCVNGSMSLVQSFSSSSAHLRAIPVKDYILISDDLGYYLYDGTTSSVIYENINYSGNPNGKIKILYEDDNNIVFTRYCYGYGVFVYNFSTGELKVLIEENNDWVYKYVIDETKIIFSNNTARTNKTDIDFFVLDCSVFEVLASYRLLRGGYDVFLMIEDMLYVGSSIPNENGVHRLDLSTFTIKTLHSQSAGVNVYGYNDINVIIYNKAFIIDLDKTTDKCSYYSIDLLVSEPENGIFYSSVISSLETVGLRYRYTIQSDLTIVRELAIFE